MKSYQPSLPNAAMPGTPGLSLYLLFIISWFLHVPARLEFLGTIRFDLVLICILTVLALTKAEVGRSPPSQADKVLRILIVYAIVTIPFVYWPGSVIKSGLPNFIKAIVFFYFTVAFVRTEADLRKFVLVFVACQILRILEPLYLNVTQDYWGGDTSMGDWESMERLSGAPSDVINPNGLAFLVCTVLPFLYYLGGMTLKSRVMTLMVAPACLYVLALSGSRSGIIGLTAVVLGIAMKTRSRASFLLVSIVAAVVMIAGFTFLPPEFQDRYLSIVGKGEKNSGTVEQRLGGMEPQLEVILHRPIFGHGLGTSAEANANFTASGPYAGREMPAHNLYLEIGQEMGVFGVLIFLVFIKAIFSGFSSSRKVNWHDPGGFPPRLIDAMQVWLVMNVVFSFASYGLSSYEWYLFGGLSVVLQRLAALRAVVAQEDMRDGDAEQKRPVSAKTIG